MKFIPFAVLLALFLTPVAALAQQSQQGESDEAFMSRIEREMNTLASRADRLEQMAREGTHSQARSMRLKTRSLRKRIEKEQERMAEQYLSRDEVGFDRGQWNAVVRRFDLEITQMERTLRPF